MKSCPPPSDEQRAALDEAMAATARIIAAQPERKNDPTLPIYRLDALDRLEQHRLAFEAGNRFSLPTAIRICANHDLPLPDWASKAYIAAFDQVLNARAASWDEVFGKPYPKGTNLAATRKRRTLKYAVALRINAVLGSEPHTPIDEALFERVGAEFHIGKTLAAALYYAAPEGLRRPWWRKRH